MKNCSKKINLLFVMMQMEMGGSERLVHALASNLDRTFFRPAIAWFHGGKILEEFKDLRVPLHHVPKVKRIDFSTLHALSKIIKANDIHVVNAHHFMSFIYSFYGSKMNGAKLIYTEHSEWELQRTTAKWRTAGNCLLRLTDAAVGVSAAVRQQIIDTFRIDPSKAFSIQNGISLSQFSQNKTNNTLKRELGISEREKVIGIVANLKKNKNHIFLLNAFNELRKECKAAKLLIIGQGFHNDPDNTRPHIEYFIKKHGLSNNVLLLGYRPDIAALLSVMDIFCLTSFKEGLPISLLEAMASGLPVVGTDCDGIRDVVRPGRNGFLVPVNDGIGLQKALRVLLTDEPLRRIMGREAKALAAEYSLQHCVARYEELFLSVAATKSRHTHPTFAQRGAADTMLKQTETKV
jgi:glycosyltransferase involved in cell wall biosynthesis